MKLRPVGIEQILGQLTPKLDKRQTQAGERMRQQRRRGT
jgi:hypothetical protein